MSFEESDKAIKEFMKKSGVRAVHLTAYLNKFHQVVCLEKEDFEELNKGG